jgi:phosphoenolpyruvate-protein phosphotransferase (PTS system enzyme I)
VNEHAIITGLAYKGLTASIGFAYGPLVRADRAAGCEPVAAAPSDERAALRAALISAGQQIAKLAESVGGDAAQILEFQVALLEDDDFLDPIFAAIAERVPAHTAWSAALEAQVDDYNAAADEYLQARSSDLADLRDRVLRTLRGGGSEVPRIPAGAIVLAEDLPPSQFLEIDWSAGGGLALLRGSPASHVAMLARARGLPMLVQLGAVPANARTALLDGEVGILELDPDREQIGLFERRRDLFHKNRASSRAILAGPTASWAGEEIKLLINIQRVEDLEHADAQYADGIGLMRTEFLLGQQSGLPDEEMQFRAYDAVLRWAGKRPVTIRTFDAGGDKPVPGFTVDGEANPFLGVRGLRLCLARPDVFRVQLRALARAAVHDNLKVMLPMVTAPTELEAARQIFIEAVDQLQSEGIPAALPKIGVMVEVPAAALAIDQFDAAFLSIGSNDLAQYLMACDRTNGALTNLIDPLQPAMLNLIKHIVDHGGQDGREVSLCGDMAGDPRCTAGLLSCGLRELSVNPSALALIKQTIDGLSSGSSRV